MLLFVIEGVPSVGLVDRVKKHLSHPDEVSIVIPRSMYAINLDPDTVAAMVAAVASVIQVFLSLRNGTGKRGDHPELTSDHSNDEKGCVLDEHVRTNVEHLAVKEEGRSSVTVLANGKTVSMKLEVIRERVTIKIADIESRDAQ
jgi:hypothetical protein